MNEDQQSSSLTMGTILTHCGVVLDTGVLDLDDNFDSCITTTLTLFLSNTTPSSVSLFLIPLALSCRTLNVPRTPACTWWNRPEEDPSSGKLESSMSQFYFGFESVIRVNTASLHIRAATTSTSGMI